MWKNFDADEKKVTSMKDEAPSVENTTDKKEIQSRMKERKKIRFHFPDSDENDLRKGNTLCQSFRYGTGTTTRRVYVLSN